MIDSMWYTLSDCKILKKQENLNLCFSVEMQIPHGTQRKMSCMFLESLLGVVLLQPFLKLLYAYCHAI